MGCFGLTLSPWT
uniref:Uncharacterized protein n=1 Tax=Arundo donax TaxID=35708 RepID=A0A0A9H6C1_ARUDO